MIAKNLSGHAPGGKRMQLSKILPLQTPLVVQFFPIYACNFTCKYCIFSIPLKKRSFISDVVIMDYALFTKSIDDLIKFPNKIKTIRFVGMGEPLLHPKIDEMVAYTVKKNIAENVEILTNASLLTPHLADKLINAGLTRLVISIQGTSAQKYKEVSHVNLQFDEFIKNIKYFFDHKTKTTMHIKIIDIALENEKDKQKFFDIFGNICDTIGIEYASPIFPGVAYNKELQGHTVTQFGLRVEPVVVCPQPFFTMQINPDGNVVPCYSVTYPAIMGNCTKQSLSEIWNGTNYRTFRRKMLDGTKNVCALCSKCEIIKHRLFPEDNLNHAAKRLKKYYSV